MTAISGESPTDEQRLNQILIEAFELDTEERISYLQKACAGNEALLEEAMAYLGHEEELGDFLEQPAAAVLQGSTLDFLPTVHNPDTASTEAEGFEVRIEPDEDEDGSDSGAFVGLKIRQFRLVRPLGSGGMGKLYVGFDENLRREVAIKTLRRRYLRRSRTRAMFLREARILSRLEHPNICRIYDYIEGEKADFFVLELIRGQHLAECEPMGLAVGHRLRIAEQIAQALAAAHAEGVIHCDLKPTNVMITERGDAKVLDFGIARTLSRSARPNTSQLGHDPSGLTWQGTEGMVIGTPGYMSPEQARGEPIEAPTDIFALSLVLQELFTGDPAYPRNLTMEVLGDRMTAGRAEIPRGLKRELLELLLEMRSSDPTARPTAAEVAARLQWMTAVEASDYVPVRKPPRREVVPKSKGSTQGHRERRQITVVNAFRQGERSDEELMVLGRKVAARWNGYMETAKGGRLVLIFGYPVAQEGETVQAVNAARELGHKSGLQVGVHTGLGLVTRDVGGERMRLGPTLVLADAVRRSAEPGQVALSHSTHRLVERFFRLRSGEQTLQRAGGREETVFLLEGLRQEPRVDGTPLVARGQELEILRGRLRTARTGQGQAVLLVGPAGIGKSRLVRELLSKGRESGVGSWVLQASPETRSSPLRPVLDPLRRILSFPEAGDAERPTETLEKMLGKLGLDPEESLPFLAPVLGLSLEDRYATPDLGPRRLQRRILETLLEVLLAAAEVEPRILLVEDLHWLDPSTLELLGLMLEEVEAVPILLLLTSRTGQELTGAESARAFTRLPLDALDLDETEAFIAQLAGGEVAPSLCQAIYRRTDGVPLFVEELTRDLLESGKLQERFGRLELAMPEEDLELPVTLRDSLVARLDRMGAVRRTAQVAAVLGRSFRLNQLEQVSDRDAETLGPELDNLLQAGILLRRGVGSRRLYQFKHVLIRDAAYETLYTAERRELHGRVAKVLLDDPEVRRRAPERLAHHLSASGDEAGSVEWWLRAGERAIAHSAHREGCDHLERGLAIVRSLPQNRERDRQELAFLTQLGAATSVLRGYSATEVEQTWDRAQDLCRSLTTSPQLFWVVWGSWSFHLVRGQLREALELGSWLVGMADSLMDSNLRLVAHGTLGLARYFLGDLEAAKKALEMAQGFDDPGRDHLIASASGQDAGVVVHATRAFVLWHLGDDDGAVAASREAVALAERVGSSYSLAFAHVYAARLQQSRRDLEALRHHSAEVMRLSGEKGYFWLVQGQFFLACGIGETARRSQREGKEAEAAELYREAIQSLAEAFAGYQGVGARVSSTYMLAQWTELYLWAGELGPAREKLAKAFEWMEQGDETYWRPELWRLEGLLRRAEGKGSEAQGALEQALELARSAGDRAFEARALTALGDEG